jgi:hypothetical protein
MTHVPVGASTKAVWVAAIGAGLAFVVEWAQSGSAPTWLAAISGVLILANNAFRSWQATSVSDPIVVADSLVDDPPVIPTDTTAG